MPPGDYLLCAKQRSRTSSVAAGVARHRCLVDRIPLDGEHPLSLALTADNAITWCDIFQLSQAN